MLVVFVLLTAVGAAQRVALGSSEVEGRTYTHYNNYVIFKQSFVHLAAGRDLYMAYPDEHWDLYKYSPTFAALMAPFSVMPDAVGVVVWGLAGSIALFVGLWRVPVGDERSRMAAAWFLTLPLLQSVQNSQSNQHLAGLILLTAVWLEARKPASAALAAALAFFLKIYGGAVVVLAAMYPWRLAFLARLASWLVGLGLLPLLFVSPAQLVALYSSWTGLLAADHSASTGVSVMGWMHNWFGIDPPKTVVAAIGLAIMLTPLTRVRAYADPAFRMIFLAALLVWLVIFNHKAEPNTFIIAVTGVALWFIARPRTWWSVALVTAVFVFTCLSTTSIFPLVIRRTLVQPYSLRVLPCILVWVAAVADLLRPPGRPRSVDTRAGWSSRPDFRIASYRFRSVFTGFASSPAVMFWSVTSMKRLGCPS